MGAGSASAARLCPKAPTPNPRCCSGGQASSPSLFGLRFDGDTGSAPASVAVRPAAQAAPQVRPAATASSLSFGQRRARLRFLMHRPVPASATMAHAATASTLRDDHDWRELADLAATPEWDRALAYGGVETACAQD